MLTRMNHDVINNESFFYSFVMWPKEAHTLEGQKYQSKEEQE